MIETCIISGRRPPVDDSRARYSPPNGTDFHLNSFVFLSGIVHSEMPGWEKTRGLQLWVNLPRLVKLAIIIINDY